MHHHNNHHLIPPEFVAPIKFCVFNIAWTWLASILTGNVSQVDRVWTFLPTLYTAYYTIYPLLPGADPALKSQGVSPRAALMLFLQLVWMFRLSYNTWRRGLFSLKDEDYRWEICRARMPGWAFQIVNFFFIAVTQNILLFLLGLPAHHALIRQPTSLGTSDIILGELALVVIALEFVSDNQQWSYQNYKRKGVINPDEWIGARIQWTEDDKQRGFITRGLWAYSRHPNCACEQLFWYITTLFPVVGATHLPSKTMVLLEGLWPILPAVSLGILFLSSTLFTESISAKKYPDYAAYQARVGMFWPVMTYLKGLVLQSQGTKEKVERQVWGAVKGKRIE